MNSFNAEIYNWLEVCGSTGLVLFGIFCFMIGGCFGSFTTACVWRIPRNISILWPPSSCPKCKHRISPLENIPMLSWLMLRGKCSGCGLPISPRYFWIEFITALLFLGAGLRYAIFMPDRVLGVIPQWVLIVLAVGSACTDIELRIIPDKFTITTLLLGLLCAWFLPCSSPVPHLTPFGALVFSTASAAVFAIFGYGLAWLGKLIFKKDALGLGDVKYLIAAASILGVFGTVSMLMLACCLSLLWILFYRLRKGKFRKAIPFAPFLAAATALWILFGFNPYIR